MEKLLFETGKRYRARNGDIWRPIRPVGCGAFVAHNETLGDMDSIFRQNGAYWPDCHESPYDLMRGAIDDAPEIDWKARAEKAEAERDALEADGQLLQSDRNKWREMWGQADREIANIKAERDTAVARLEKVAKFVAGVYEASSAGQQLLLRGVIENGSFSYFPAVPTRPLRVTLGGE
jgi:hypothetical protein